MASEEQPPTQPTPTLQSLKAYLTENPAVALLAVVATLALVAVLVLGVLLVRNGSEGDNGGGETAVSGTPTPFPSGGSVPSGNSLVVGVSESNTISVTVDVPVTLRLGAQTYPVETQQVAFDGVWSPQVEEASAVWVYGSIINYVIGLSDTDTNRALLDQLAPGDDIVLQTRGGTTFTFAFTSRDTVPTTNRDIFAQSLPGITLILVGGDGQERLVVNGRYVVADTVQTDTNIIELGETAQLDNVQITVNSVSYVPTRPEIPAGFAFFLVDYEVQNLGLTALDSSSLRLSLTDLVGNQYAINAVASQVGNFPALGGFINAGQVVQASAGFQVPAGLNSDNVTLTVLRQDTNGTLQVQLPFSGSGTAAAQGAAITLNRAEVSSDFTSLILAGQVTNVGERPLVIVEQDVKLQSDDGASYLLLSTNPPFPWTIPPGQTLQYTFAYQRPAAATAVFTILNQPFQLNNLR